METNYFENLKLKQLWHGVWTHMHAHVLLVPRDLCLSPTLKACVAWSCVCPRGQSYPMKILWDALIIQKGKKKKLSISSKTPFSIFFYFSLLSNCNESESSISNLIIRDRSLVICEMVGLA